MTRAVVLLIPGKTTLLIQFITGKAERLGAGRIQSLNGTSAAEGTKNLQRLEVPSEGAVPLETISPGDVLCIEVGLEVAAMIPHGLSDQ